MKERSGFYLSFSITVILVSFLLSLDSCKKLENFPDDPIHEKDSTFLILHRGGGHSGAGRNTLEGAVHGMKVADGIELDIQMSQDNTPWLEHDSRIPACGGKEEACFINLRDHEIEERIGCGDFYTVRLEAVFIKAALYYPDTKIILDCKAWPPCGLSELNAIRSMKKMAREIIRLAQRYNLEDNIIVDSGVKSFLKEIDKNSTIETYYRSFSSLDKAARNARNVNADGLSLDQKRYHLTKLDVKMLNQKGFEVQLWTIDNKEELEETLAVKPQHVLTEVVMGR